MAVSHLGRKRQRKGDNFLAWDERKMQGSNATVAALNLTPTSHIRNDAKEAGYRGNIFPFLPRHSFSPIAKKQLKKPTK